MSLFFKALHPWEFSFPSLKEENAFKVSTVVPGTGKKKHKKFHQTELILILFCHLLYFFPFSVHVYVDMCVCMGVGVGTCTYGSLKLLSNVSCRCSLFTEAGSLWEPGVRPSAQPAVTGQMIPGVHVPSTVGIRHVCPVLVRVLKIPFSFKAARAISPGSSFASPAFSVHLLNVFIPQDQNTTFCSVS